MSMPLTDRAVVDALAADLSAADYTTDGVAGLLGADAGAAFSRGLGWSALRATDRAPPDQHRLAILVRLFLLGAEETRPRVAAAFPGAGVDALTAAGVLEPTPGGFRAVLDIRPHSDGARDFLVVSDQDAALRPGPVRRDHVLGIGGASVSLAHAVVRTPSVGRSTSAPAAVSRRCTWPGTAPTSSPPTPTSAPWRWRRRRRGSTACRGICGRAACSSRWRGSGST